MLLKRSNSIIKNNLLATNPAKKKNSREKNPKRSYLKKLGVI